jgi:hypothetical protein
MMTAVEANLAPEVTDEDRRELRAAYAEFRQALKEKRVDRRELENLNRVLRIRSGEPISRDRVHQMTEFFRRAARSAPAPATSPTPILVAPAP